MENKMSKVFARFIAKPTKATDRIHVYIPKQEESKVRPKLNRDVLITMEEVI